MLGVRLAHRAHGESLRVTQAEVIDFDASSGLVRGTCWTHLYSPRTRNFDLALVADPKLPGASAQPQGWLGWQGLPGNGVGGLSATQTTPVQVQPYQEETPGSKPSITSLPLQAASSKALAGRWWGDFAPDDKSSLALDAYGLLKGELVNPVPYDLLEPRLLFEGWMYYLPNPLPASDKVDIGRLKYFGLEARLTQRVTTGDKDVSTPWDPEQLDVSQIVPLMLFHGAARGQSYTGLSHRFQTYLDLSEHLTTGRAVLVGRTRERATQVAPADAPCADDDYDQSWTWWRVVLPVVGRSAAQ